MVGTKERKQKRRPRLDRRAEEALKKEEALTRAPKRSAFPLARSSWRQHGSRSARRCVYKTALVLFMLAANLSHFFRRSPFFLCLFLLSFLNPETPPLSPPRSPSPDRQPVRLAVLHHPRQGAAPPAPLLRRELNARAHGRE